MNTKESLIIIGVLLLLITIRLWRSQFALRPNKRLNRKLNDRILVRYTSQQTGQKIRFNAKVPDDFSTMKKEAVYFFVGEPNIWRKAINKITSHEMKYKIPYIYLDQKKVLYRARDKVVAYMGDIECIPLLAENGKATVGKGYKIFSEIAITLRQLGIMFFTFVSLCVFLGAVINLWVNSESTTILLSVGLSLILTAMWFGFILRIQRRK